MKNFRKLTLFLIITFCLVTIVVFEFESEKYYLRIEFETKETNVDRIESKSLYLGNSLNKFFPNNPVSIMLYDFALENYNSRIGFEKRIFLLGNINNEELIREKYNNYKKDRDINYLVRDINHFYNIKLIDWNQRELFVEEIYEDPNFKGRIISLLETAQSYENEGKYQEALETYEKILELDKFNFTSLIGSAIMNEKLGKELETKQKIKTTLEIVKLNHKLPISFEEKREKINDIHKLLGGLKGNPNLLFLTYNDLLTVDSFNKKFLEGYVELLIKKKAYFSAEQAYKKLIMLEPENKDYLIKRADLQYLKYSNTKEKINSLLETAQNYENEGKYPNAIIEFNRIIEIDFRISEAYYGLIRINAQLGDEEEVLDLLSKHELPNLEKANSLYFIGHYEEALKIYDEIFEKNQSEEIWEKRKTTSEKLYENPNFNEKVNSLLEVAQSYENESKYKEALETYEKILESDRFVIKGIEGALRSSIYFDNESETRKLLKIIEIMPEVEQQSINTYYIQFMHDLAINYQNLGKNGAAISVYKDLILYDEFDKKALEGYAKLSLKMKMYIQASQAYQKLVSLEPENSFYKEKLKEIDKMEN